MSELSALMLVLEEMRQEEKDGGIMRLGFKTAQNITKTKRKTTYLQQVLK